MIFHSYSTAVFRVPALKRSDIGYHPRLRSHTSLQMTSGKPRRVEDPGSLKRIGRRGRFGRMKLNPGGMVSACPDLSGTAASRSRFAYFLSAGSNDTQDNPAHTVARRIRSKSHVRHGTHFGWHSTRTW